MWGISKILSRKDFFTLITSYLNIFANYLKVTMKIFNSLENLFAVIAGSTFFARGPDVLIKIQQIELALIFLVLRIWLNSLEFNFAVVSFCDIFNFWFHFSWNFNNLKILRARRALCVISFFEIDLAFSAKNFSAVFAFLNVKWDFLTLKARVKFLESLISLEVIGSKILLLRLSYYSFNLIIGDLEKHSVGLKKGLIFIHFIF